MIDRRHLLRQTVAGGAVFGLGDLGFLNRLPAVSAAEAAPDPNVVRFRPEIEPTVRLIEDTPQGKLLEAVADRIKAGKLSYQEVLGALLLAGVRNIQPRPSVGFKFHAVLVVNSAHLASMASPDQERWLPIFWALDEFKNSQARDIKEGDWTMQPVEESRVPPPHRAKAAFVEAMERWDVEAVDAAVAGLARSAPSHEVFELFARFGARDFRSIGHKAIFVANSWRTLQLIGWQHAEPVLRSLAYALLNHNGEPNPADNDLEADRPWRENVELAKSLKADWRSGAVKAESTSEILASLRSESSETACRLAADSLERGTAVQSVFDALFAGAGELLIRQPGIVALHAVTSTNALRYLFETTADDALRRRLLLQNVAWLPLFREAMKSRGKVGAGRIDQLEPIAAPQGHSDEAISGIFHEIGNDRARAAGKLLGYLEGGAKPEPLIDAARRLIFLKGTNSHDYKFSSAVLEDFYHLSPEWRNRFLAASAFNLRGSAGKDNSLVQRTREALGV